MAEKVKEKHESVTGVLELLRQVIRGELKPKSFAISVIDDSLLFEQLVGFRTDELTIRYNDISDEIEMSSMGFHLNTKPERITHCSCFRGGHFSICICLDIKKFHKDFFSHYNDDEGYV